MHEPSPDLSAILSLADFEVLASARLERGAYDYIAGGAGDELTLADNPMAWRRWRFRPRVLVDVSSIDTSATVLGAEWRLPVGLAPMAFQHHAHPEAELPAARAVARAGSLYCLSTMSSRSIEEVAAAGDDAAGGPRWFQLYVHRDRERSAELVSRAEAAGYGAIVLTTDFPVAGIRERDARNKLAYPQAYGNFDLPRETSGDGSLLPVVVGAMNDASLTWDDVAWLRGLTRLPVVIKGILTGSDAALAIDHGASAVWVSNHGGRQLDRTPATAEVLADIVQAVAGRAEVYVDGGIQRGADVLTALALGARAAFIGRPLSYALAVGGEAGVLRAFELLEQELRTDMALLGVTRPDQLGRDFLLGT